MGGIFLSCDGSLKSFGNGLVAALNLEGISVWSGFDRTLEARSDFWRVVDRSIKRSQAVVAVLGSGDNQHVLNECRKAGYSKKIVYVFASDINDSDFERLRLEQFGSVDSVYLADWAGDLENKEFQKLVQQLEFNIEPDVPMDSGEVSVTLADESIRLETNINSSLRYNALSVIENASSYHEMLRSNNRLAAEFPNEREKLLGFLSYVEKEVSELSRIIPDSDVDALPSENKEILSWLDKFWRHLEAEFLSLFTPENMAKLVVPVGLIFGLGSIGGLIGGVPGFALGSLAGQFLSGHVKASKLPDRVSEELRDD